MDGLFGGLPLPLSCPTFPLLSLSSPVPLRPSQYTAATEREEGGGEKEEGESGLTLSRCIRVAEETNISPYLVKTLKEKLE